MKRYNIYYHTIQSIKVASTKMEKIDQQKNEEVHKIVMDIYKAGNLHKFDRISPLENKIYEMVNSLRKKNDDLERENIELRLHLQYNSIR